MVVFFVVFFPNISPAINAASQVRFAPSDGWCEALSWMKDNTPGTFGDHDFYYDFYEAPFDYPGTAYGVASLWDYGYWIIRIGHRLSNCDPGADEPERQKVASLFTAQDEASAAPIISQLKSRYVIIDYSTAVPTPKYYVVENSYGFSGKFYAVVTYAGSDEKNFYDTYGHLKDGKLEQVPIFYPEYYRSLAVRLYNFNGNEVIPKTSTVINYEERLSSDGTSYKQITSAQSFPSYKEAEAYVASQKSGNYRIVGNDPFLSPVPLEKLKQYKLVYSSKSSKLQPNKSDTIPEVKIFEYIE